MYDTSGVNRAFNKPAIQSSTYTGHNWGPDPASKAVNGVLNDYSHTNNDAGKQYTQEQLAYANHAIQTTFLSLTLFLL